VPRGGLLGTHERRAQQRRRARAVIGVRAGHLGDRRRDERSELGLRGSCSDGKWPSLTGRLLLLGIFTLVGLRRACIWHIATLCMLRGSLLSMFVWHLHACTIAALCMQQGLLGGQGKRRQDSSDSLTLIEKRQARCDVPLFVGKCAQRRAPAPAGELACTSSRMPTPGRAEKGGSMRRPAPGASAAADSSAPPGRVP